MPRLLRRDERLVSTRFDPPDVPRRDAGQLADQPITAGAVTSSSLEVIFARPACHRKPVPAARAPSSAAFCTSGFHVGHSSIRDTTSHTT